MICLDRRRVVSMSTPRTKVNQGSNSNFGSPSSIPVRGNRPVPISTGSSGSLPSAEAASNVSDSRKRQNKRDDAIRQKMERDLSKKTKVPAPGGLNGSPTRSRNAKRGVAAGTVLSLKPSPALQIRASTPVAEAAQLMAARREDCVLVIDGDDRIAGIFTAKDLAFRVVGQGIDAHDVLIEQIMTKNPMCARTDTSATEALDLMVRKGFRHLPVMDENQDIAGVLDITKCFYEAMEKLERAYSSSRKLYDALEGVQTELGSSQPAQIIQYVEALRQKMSGPDLASVLDGHAPVMVNVKTSVYQAASMMCKNHTTAVLVTDQNNITGIFTSKDVVLRVIAPGLDPANCSVVRVMTPHPDVAPMSMSIQDALRKMHDGHYLNLPVLDAEGQVGGMVDVLKLTYATLEQINSMSSADAEGPAWNRFWLSMDNDSESITSDGPSHSQLHGRSGTPQYDRHGARSGSPQHNENGVGPNDSASYINDLNLPMTPGFDEVPFVFKLKAPSGKVHRLQAVPKVGLASLRETVLEKLARDADHIDGVHFGISFVDDEGDVVSITNDQDLVDSVEMARRNHRDKVDLFVHHPEKPAVAPTLAPHPTASQPAAHASKTDRHDHSKEKPAGEKQHIPGVPNELVLPGAVGVLAVVIIAMFAFGRSSK